MPDFTIKQINTIDVAEGMELAEDIIYANGLLLFPRDTVLTDKHIIKMNLYQIHSVYIKIFNDHPNYDKTLQPKKLTTEQQNLKQRFAKFSKDYEVQEKKAQEQLTKISEGHSVKITDLFSTSAQLVQDLGTQSDLFSHLCHLKTSDDATYTHCLNVSMLSNIFAGWLHFDEQQTESLTVAGLLHDIGKTKIDRSILNKPGKLTPEEFQIVKDHTKIGYQMLRDKDMDEGIKLAVLLHHEKMDGTGYPFGMSWDKVHPYAKIISILDIYDAMTSARTYHKRFSPFRVIKFFEDECYGVLDTYYMYIFLERIAHNYIGSLARLSTGEECEIKFIHKKTPSRPIVQIDNLMINLQQEPSIFIEEIL
jgi:putative nucleotidyltransferase with HDIG domain